MTYEHGQWNAICDRCGFQRKSGELRKEWTGLMVCHDTCFETRNAQEFVRGVPDRQNVPWARPEPEPVFLIDFYRREDVGNILRETGTPLLREV